MTRPDLTVIAGDGPGDPTIDGACRALNRYGYGGTDAGDAADWPAMWDRLRGDFVTPPTYEALPPSAQAAARAYMQRRQIADHLLAACRAAHDDLRRGGIDSAHVEAYAAARDAYEQSVEAFGTAREDVERLLPSVPA